MRRFLVALTATGVLLASVTAAQAQERKPGFEGALQSYVQMNKPGIERGLEKAVPRTDKAESTVVGVLTFIDSVDFLDDGTPFRLVFVDSKKPLRQEIPIFCLGSSAVNTCGRLGLRRRVSFTSDILVDDDGFAIFVAKRVQT